MSMRITTLALSVLALLLTPSLTFSQKPNYIIVLGDDVGWDAFGCTGMKTARTPSTCSKLVHSDNSCARVFASDKRDAKAESGIKIASDAGWLCRFCASPEV